MKATFVTLLAVPLAFWFSSCESVPTPTDPPEGDPHGSHEDEVVPLPEIQWGLQPAGVGYDLDLVLDDDREVHIANGGEYVSARRASRSSRNVPRGTVSAFEVLLPDGEIDLYWVEEGRSGSLVVFRKSYDAMDRVWSDERRLRSVNY